MIVMRSVLMESIVPIKFPLGRQQDFKKFLIRVHMLNLILMDRYCLFDDYRIIRPTHIDGGASD